MTHLKPTSPFKHTLCFLYSSMLLCVFPFLKTKAKENMNDTCETGCMQFGKI